MSNDWKNRREYLSNHERWKDVKTCNNCHSVAWIVDEMKEEEEEMRLLNEGERLAKEGNYEAADQQFLCIRKGTNKGANLALSFYHHEGMWRHAVAFEKKHRRSIRDSLRQEHQRLLAQRRTTQRHPPTRERVPPPNAHPTLQRGLRVYGTAQENFAEAQKWRGISHFGEVPGGQRPNNNNALHYFNAALSIDPTHEFAISHRADCLWTLGRQHEAIGVLSVGLAKNQFPNHADTVRGWLNGWVAQM